MTAIAEGFYGLNYFYYQMILSTGRGGHRLIMITTTTDRLGLYQPEFYQLGIY